MKSKQKKSIQQLEKEKKERSFISYVTGNIINISLTFLILRVLSLIAFASLFGLQWWIARDFKYIPVLAFESDFEKFSQMNTYSQLFVAIFMLVMFIKVSFYQNKKHSIRKQNSLIVSWYLSLWMIVIMYLASIYINPAIRFQFDQRLGFVIIPIVLLSTIVFLKWKEKTDNIKNKQLKNK